MRGGRANEYEQCDVDLIIGRWRMGARYEFQLERIAPGRP